MSFFWRWKGVAILDVGEECRAAYFPSLWYLTMCLQVGAYLSRRVEQVSL